MSWLSDPQAWIALVTLTSLEIVLGIDNIIFISILVGRLPEEQRSRARLVGLGLAMIMRILLLLSITWIMRLNTTLFTLFHHAFSGRDIILFVGGLFLIAKSTREIHESLEGPQDKESGHTAASFWSVIALISVIDIVFSLDSVITAVGLANDVPVMILAIILAVIVMMASAEAIGRFVDKHPTVKMLALSFLILIGVNLSAESLGFHIPKGYVYFAMAFSVVVEMLNIRLRDKQVRPVHLHKKLDD